jgi:hypothetical protein
LGRSFAIRSPHRKATTKVSMTRGTLVPAICGLIVSISAASAPSIRADPDDSFAAAQAAAGAPTIASLAPSAGPVGTEVTIVGTNFTTENNTIQFSSAARSFAAGSPVGSDNGTRLQFRVTACPSYAPLCPMAFVPPGNYVVTVRNANGTSNAATFAIVSP